MASFQAKGLKDVVLCPGSRSAPLSLVCGFLERSNLIRLTTSIDERSAGFFALGVSAYKGLASAVITTSGTAVANLLPAAVEADRSCQPLLFISADRPQRLKNCGANQTVNQEDFLSSVCRGVFQGPSDGMHSCLDYELEQLVNKAWEAAHFYRGPIHLNLPFEEPLYADQLEQNEVVGEIFLCSLKKDDLVKKQEKSYREPTFSGFEDPPPFLDPLQPGVIVAGPWRGLSPQLQNFRNSVRSWQFLSGWPVFADPLSGISSEQPGLIRSWDLLLPSLLPIQSKEMQLLRLGPVPASRNLELWMKQITGKQILISEGDVRDLDPLHTASQWDGGLSNWIDQYEINNFNRVNHGDVRSDFSEWLEIDNCVQNWLNSQLTFEGPINEPSLARWLSREVPDGMSIMLAASSPVRDWIKYVGEGALERQCFSFRGASGIDGTLSLAMGLATDKQILLVSGDLALLHDTNGWLFSHPKSPPLVVLLIDNHGGGIFEQVGTNIDSQYDLDRLFAMPQKVDPLLIAEANGIPYRQIATFEDLTNALEWGFSLNKTVLLRVCTDRFKDAALRKSLNRKLVEHISKIK